jgi:hypothetical protein
MLQRRTLLKRVHHNPVYHTVQGGMCSALSRVQEGWSRSTLAGSFGFEEGCGAVAGTLSSYSEIDPF